MWLQRSSKILNKEVNVKNNPVIVIGLFLYRKLSHNSTFLLHMYENNDKMSVYSIKLHFTKDKKHE